MKINLTYRDYYEFSRRKFGIYWLKILINHISDQQQKEMCQEAIDNNGNARGFHYLESKRRRYK